MSSDIVKACSNVGMWEMISKNEEHISGNKSSDEQWQKQAENIIMKRRQYPHVYMQYRQTARVKNPRAILLRVS